MMRCFSDEEIGMKTKADQARHGDGSPCLVKIQSVAKVRADEPRGDDDFLCDPITILSVENVVSDFADQPRQFRWPVQ